MAECNLDNETHFTLMRLLGDNPSVSQRELARTLGISVGKANYCLKALLDKGYIKATNIRRSDNRRAYLYQLTPAGIAAKAKATKYFLAYKQAEHARLAKEIEQLRSEAQAPATADQPRTQPALRHT